MDAKDEESRIFRAEALQAAARRLQGNVLVPRPRLLIFGTTLALLVLPALTALLTFGTYTPRQAVSGYLVATDMHAIAPARSTLEAHLLAPAQTIGFLRVGQQVVVRTAAFRDQRAYCAVVRAISTAALPSAQWSDGLLRGAEPHYRVVATLQEPIVQGQRVAAGNERAAAEPGMILTADILLEKRPLWRLLLGPLLRFRGDA